mmetsp:Transcript_50688/g.120715  ORF Transcript_50688/g.120715 Transcript_50688/m.120715 type:complete len:204 (+) Transcript_50688:151-762(+)
MDLVPSSCSTRRRPATPRPSLGASRGTSRGPARSRVRCCPCLSTRSSTSPSSGWWLSWCRRRGRAIRRTARASSSATSRGARTPRICSSRGGSRCLRWATPTTTSSASPARCWTRSWRSWVRGASSQARAGSRASTGAPGGRPTTPRGGSRPRSSRGSRTSSRRSSPTRAPPPRRPVQNRPRPRRFRRRAPRGRRSWRRRRRR